jgi:hypothetical protein
MNLVGGIHFEMEKLNKYLVCSDWKRSIRCRLETLAEDIFDMKFGGEAIL